MHSYDYRCKDCKQRFTLTYKSYKEFDAATPVCVNCGSLRLSRLIQKIAIQKPAHDYSRMSSNEMVGVLESGDSRQVGEMFQQIGGTSPELGVPYHEATEKLLAGQKMDKVEKELQAQTAPSNPAP